MSKSKKTTITQRNRQKQIASRSTKRGIPQRAGRPKPFRRSKRPFRLLDLPLEIQRMVFENCLISSSCIVIRVDLSNGGNGFSEIPRADAAAYDGLIALTSDHSNLDYVVRTKPDVAVAKNIFNVNLLYVSRRVYAEAASVLYSRNAFYFEGEHGLDAFPFFVQRLTKTSLAFLQNLDLTMPSDPRFGEEFPWYSEYPRASLQPWLVDTINKLHGLRSLRLHLNQDITAEDLQCVSQLPRGTPSRKTVLQVDGRECIRMPRIHSDILAHFRDRGWEVVGIFEEIDSDPS